MADIPEVKRTELDENLIKDFSSEEDFMEVSVCLMIEAGSYVSVVGCILPINTQAWDSNQAVRVVT